MANKVIRHADKLDETRSEDFIVQDTLINRGMGEIGVEHSGRLLLGCAT